MPLHEYQCEVCGHRFEVIQKFSDSPVETCAACGKGPVRQLISSPAFQFKGSGWYITDYAKKGSEGPPSEAGKSEAGKADAKDAKDTKDTKDTKKSEPAPADVSAKSDTSSSAPASTSTTPKD